MKKKIKEMNGTKISPVQSLKSIMTARRRLQVEISDLRRMLSEKSSRRVELEAVGNLDDTAMINEVGKLQILVELLPQRIAFKEEEEAKAEGKLIKATNDFIRGHLGPYVRQLAARTRMIVENELVSHVRDRSALIVAVAQSERVRTINGLDFSVRIQPMRGAIVHAEDALKAWAAANEFEKKFLAQ